MSNELPRVPESVHPVKGHKMVVSVVQTQMKPHMSDSLVGSKLWWKRELSRAASSRREAVVCHGVVDALSQPEIA